MVLFKIDLVLKVKAGKTFDKIKGGFPHCLRFKDLLSGLLGLRFWNQCSRRCETFGGILTLKGGRLEYTSFVVLIIKIQNKY